MKVFLNFFIKKNLDWTTVDVETRFDKECKNKLGLKKLTQYAATY